MPATPVHSVVWFEIPVLDLDKAIAFYGQVLDTTLSRDDTGPNPMAMFPVMNMAEGVSGHLYVGKPATDGAGPTIHLLVPDTAEAAGKRCTAGGGKVVSPVIEIPPGRFVYAVDPCGNSIGLFEPKR